jgi:hypothetical protein
MDKEKDGIPKLNVVNKYLSWIRAFRSFLASKDLAAVLLHIFCRPTLNHPSMEVADPLAAPLIPVGQAAIQMIPARANNPGVPAQPAGMTHENFDKLLREYYTFESKVYGYSISAIQDFIPLYDHIMSLPEVVLMQESRLLGSVICRHITAYCTNNDNDAMAGITNSKILLLSLSQFKSCTDLVRELNELYHVLPLRLAHSDSQKKLQLKAACGKDFRNFFMAHYENKTYHQLCMSLTAMEEEDAATDALSGLKSERGIRKLKSTDESIAETAMAAVDETAMEENTRSNRSTVGVRFHSSPAAYRRGSSSYRSHSRSNSNDRSYRKHDRSPSPGQYQSNRRRDYSRSNSRSPSPYRPRDRTPGRSHHVVRYENVNSQWRTGGSGYKDSRTEGIKCFNCGVMGHKSYTCPRNQAAAAAPGSGSGSGGVKCYSCGRLGHKAHECSDKRNR